MKIANGDETFTPERTLDLNENGVRVDLTSVFNPKSDDGLQVRYSKHITPNGTVRAHFHIVDQFQVFMKGAGRVGKKPMKAWAIHYADRFTPYGPITYDDNPLEWFTMRLALDPGASYMPEARDRKIEPTGRQIAAEFEIPESINERKHIDLFKPYDDGLASSLTLLPPGESWEFRVPEIAAGQYQIVARGTIEHAGLTHGPRSCIHLTPQDAPLVYTAGADGAAIVTVRFRHGADQVDPKALAMASQSDIAQRLVAAPWSK